MNRHTARRGGLATLALAAAILACPAADQAQAQGSRRGRMMPSERLMQARYQAQFSPMNTYFNARYGNSGGYGGNGYANGGYGRGRNSSQINNFGEQVQGGMHVPGQGVVGFQGERLQGGVHIPGQGVTGLPNTPVQGGSHVTGFGVVR